MLQSVVAFALVIVASCDIGLGVASAHTIQYIHDEAGNVVEVRRLAANELAIFQFAPLRGPIGSTVTIHGQGFNATPGSNAVAINGAAATVIGGTTTQLTVLVPGTATSGPISVSNGSASTTSYRNFTVTTGGIPQSTATWNPSDKGANLVLSNGNLTVSQTVYGWQLVRGTSSTSSGKKYFEIRQDTADPGPGYEIAGVAKSGASVGSYLGNGAYGWGYQHGLRRTVHNGGFSTYGTAPVSAQGTVIGVLLDLDAGTLSFSVNGALQGIAFSGLSGTFHPAVSHYALMTSTARFASSQWSYAPPAGYTQW